MPPATMPFRILWFVKLVNTRLCGNESSVKTAPNGAVKASTTPE
jgi:hypothetical protein